MSIQAPTIEHDEWSSDDRVELFTIVNGDERRTFTMPNRPHPGLALQYLKRARREGEALAASWLLEQVLGEDGYDALAAEPDVTLAMVNGIAATAMRVVTGRHTQPEPAPFPQAP